MTLVHIHAVSVGEVNAALPIIERLLIDAGVRVLVTSWTRTSQGILQKQFSGHARVMVDLLPLDTPFGHAAFYKKYQVTSAIWIDSEIWPFWLRDMKRRGIPCALVNARLSDRSFGRWRMVRPLARHLLGHFDRIMAQSAQDTERFYALGAPHAVRQRVNLKYLRPPLALRAPVLQTPSVCYLSAHPYDMDLALSAHAHLKAKYPDIRTIIVPRHPHRAAACIAQAQGRGLRAALLRDTKDAELLVGDEIGVMDRYLSLSPIVVMGKSFDPRHRGGQSPIEAAQAGRAILCGPFMSNFSAVMDDLRMAGGVVETDTDSLPQALDALLCDPERVDDLGTRAKAMTEAQRQAGPAFLDEIAAWARGQV